MRLNIYPSETNQFAECGGIMSRNSINLIDLVKEYLGGDFTNRMSFLLGERTDKTRRGINTAIPGLLSAYDNVASTPDGARRVSSAVDDADDSILGNVSSMFGAGSGSWINRGSGMLGSILGEGTLSGLSDTIGRSSGLSGKSMTMLLGFLGPLILGVLKREKQTRGLDSTGLSNLLAGQRSNISGAMPKVHSQRPASESKRVMVENRCARLGNPKEAHMGKLTLREPENLPDAAGLAGFYR
jgi:hypothetical protein